MSKFRRSLYTFPKVGRGHLPIEWVNNASDLIVRLDICKHRLIARPDDHCLAFDIERLELAPKTAPDDATRKHIELSLEEKERRRSFLHDYGIGVFTAETQLDKTNVLMTAMVQQIAAPPVSESDGIKQLLNDIVRHTEALRESYAYKEAVCYGDYAMLPRPMLSVGVPVAG